MINKLQLLFSVKYPENRDKISTILLNNWSLINKKKLNINHRLAIRVPGDPTSSVPQDGQPDNLPEQPSFDVMFEIRGENKSFQNLIDILDGFTSELEPLINKNNSAAIVGTEYKIVNGNESLFLNMVLRRPVKWSREDWHEHWLDHHAKEVLENVSGLQGYRQFHANEEFSKKASEITGLKIHDYEGTAEGYYSSLEKFLETLSDPEVSKDTGFIDHSRSVMWLYNIYE